MKDGNFNQVLIIGTVWPEPDSSAAGRRMMQLISLFRSEGWEITFASTATDSDYRADLGPLKIDCVKIDINSDRFDTWIRSLQPSIVLFDRFLTEEQFGWRVAQQCPEALRVLDTEDLHSLRKARKNALENEQPFIEKDLLNEEVAFREAASIFRCDLSLIISIYEMRILRELLSVYPDLLFYIPFMLDIIDERTTGNWPSFESRSHFITIGNFLHEPNRNAIQYLKKSLWPLIREQLPEAELHVYGAYAPQKITDYHQPEDGFHIKGRATEAKEVVENARVCLAPLRFGAGLKGKLVEAMQCGTPSVTTEIGAEGIAGELDWCGIIANRPEEFAEAAVKLYNNRKKWKRSQEKGIRIINSCFRKEQFGPELIRRITNLQENLADHRRKNFIGSMLMHHTLTSTKYMARWIEAKNHLKNKENTGPPGDR